VLWPPVGVHHQGDVSGAFRLRRQLPRVNRALEAALGYRELGWSLLPVGVDKRPHFDLLADVYRSPAWERLRTRAASEAEIGEWFSRDPNAGIAIITGAASGGLVVADFDQERPQRLIDTPTVQTGRGLHVYLQSSKRIRSRKAIGIELKAEGSYVVAPPSVHPSGRRYRWLISPPGLGHLSLPEANLADLESWQLVAPLAETCRSSQPPTDLSLLDVPTGVPTEVPTRSRAELGFLESFDADPEAVAAMCRALGISRWDGTAFHCLLHEEKHPSASVFQLEDGTYHYHDWHATPQWLTFAQVRAALAGRPGARGPELATWKLILLAEAGVTQREIVDRRRVRDGHVNADCENG
jgi:hypothetical protein